MRVSGISFATGFSLFFLIACGNASSDLKPIPLEFQTHLQSDQSASALTHSPSATRVFEKRADRFDLESFLDQAEAAASPEGKRILVVGRAMVNHRVIVIGSCWDFIFAVFNHASLGEKNQIIPFASSQSKGPYADLETLQAGDWLYYINHSFGDVEHSGIFIGFTDREQNEALILSYAGGDQALPGRYRVYDLSNVYHVIRPKSGIAAKLPPLPEFTADASPTPSPANP